ncbi:MAG TPA: hypothetical protein VM364_23150, partial [Vicinamibacterales bacterium]|nr:hypothetical protein [Vicinamibacterales bacterium]
MTRDRFASAFAPFVRRHTMVHCMRALAVAAIVSAGTLPWLIRLGMPPATAAACTAAAGLAAVVIARLRRAAAAQIARAIDARHSLHDRTSTALELPTAGDPVAKLVRDDAAAHLEALALAATFPIGVPARFAQLLAGASVAAVAAFVIPARGAPPVPTEQRTRAAAAGERAGAATTSAPAPVTEPAAPEAPAGDTPPP